MRDQGELIFIARRSRTLHRPWVTAPTSAEAFSSWLLGSKAPNRERLLVCSNEDGAIVGYFGLGEIVRTGLQSAYLGYWVGAAHARRGFMKEGMELVQRHCFRTLGLQRLEANIQPANQASIGLARSGGFLREGFSPRYLKVSGRWRDHERWALTVEDWRARQRR